MRYDARVAVKAKLDALGPSSHLSTRPNISEYHSEISTRVPHCITGAVAGRSFEYPPDHHGEPFTNRRFRKMRFGVQKHFIP